MRALRVLTLALLCGLYHMDLSVISAPLGGQTLGAGGSVPARLPVAGSAVLVVNTTDDQDDGECDAAHCSLREAMGAANFQEGPDTIGFDIPPSDPGRDGAGVCTIRPTNALPGLWDDGTTIDGYRQPGASPNTNGFGRPINAQLKVVLDGSAVSSYSSGGVEMRGSRNVVRGLVVHGFLRGIEVLDGSDNRIQGNFVGTDAGGTLDLGNACDGIAIYGLQFGAGSYDNLVGGEGPQDRNLVSGNGCAGIAVGPGSHNSVQGNYVGTDATGLEAMANDGDGIYVFSAASGDMIGGPAPHQPNLIANSGGSGVHLWSQDPVRITIRGNRIYDNAQGGIQLNAGSNADISAPDIALVRPTEVFGVACPFCTVGVFSDAGAQGAVYEGSVVANAAGAWGLVKPSGLAGPYVTATNTDELGNTSEFSAPVALAATGDTPTPTPTRTRTPTVAPAVTGTLMATATPRCRLYLPILLRGAPQVGTPSGAPGIAVGLHNAHGLCAHAT